jgi:hypothetical protein
MTTCTNLSKRYNKQPENHLHPSHLQTHVKICPADKTENQGEEESAQKVAKHQITKIQGSFP